MGSGRFSWLLGAGPLFFAALFVWAFAGAYSTPAAVHLGVLLSAAAILVAGTIAARATAEDVERFLERIRSGLERNVSGLLRSHYLHKAELEGGKPEFQRLQASYPDLWPEALRFVTEPPTDVFNTPSDRRRDGVLGLARSALAVGVLLALLYAVVISLAEPPGVPDHRHHQRRLRRRQPRDQDRRPRRLRLPEPRTSAYAPAPPAPDATADTSTPLNFEEPGCDSFQIHSTNLRNGITSG